MKKQHKLSIAADKLSIWDANFVIIDVETTGHSPQNNRITEIAYAVVRGGEILSEYSSLVNPHQFIPPFIARMTGITNAMVFSAPECSEILGRVCSALANENTVFVAHNVAFDFGFINHSLLRNGFNQLEIPQICTLKLARRILPLSCKKNVGAIAEYFDIHIKNRHRALGDAKATAQFFIDMLEISENDYKIKTLGDLLRFQNKRLKNFIPSPSYIKRITPYLDAMPDTPGVYSMFDEKENLLYVGKSKSLRDRVRSYFQPSSQHPPKIDRMVRQVHEIRWECTDTELAATILEAREINRLQPPFNSVGKSIRRTPFLRLTTDEEFPRIEWTNSIGNDSAEYFGPFRSFSAVQEINEIVQKRFNLRHCEETLTAQSRKEPCFYYHIKRCAAPCAGLQTPEEYKHIVEDIRLFLRGYADGILSQLRNEMTKAADALMFEEAATIRNRLIEIERIIERKEDVSTATNDHNVIIVLPASEREKTVEVFCIVGGCLFHQQTLGRKASLTIICNILRDAYFPTENLERKKLSYSEVNEMHIIASWIHRNMHIGKFIYTENKNYNAIIAEFTSAVRQAFDYCEETALISA